MSIDTETGRLGSPEHGWEKGIEGAGGRQRREEGLAVDRERGGTERESLAVDRGAGRTGAAA